MAMPEKTKSQLSSDETRGLNVEQTAQVMKQWKDLQHDRESIPMALSPFGDTLEGFLVYPDVWHPAKTSARYHASYLFFNNVRLFGGKKVLDMGTGTGLMGVVAGLYGASSVVLSDISPIATENARANVEHFSLQHKATVVTGDLFENVPKERFDFIIFNHPFFPGTPEEGDTISASMLNPGELIDRFLDEAKKYLEPSGRIMMPFYAKAGTRNDPVLQGPRHGYRVETTFLVNATQELQQGELTIHELTLADV